jgi:molybdopterin biosynthesis enzyme
MNEEQISYHNALQLTLDHIALFGSEKVALPYLSGRVLSEDILSLADSPSADASLRDGCARPSQIQS